MKCIYLALGSLESSISIRISISV